MNEPIKNLSVKVFELIIFPKPNSITDRQKDIIAFL